MSTTLAGPFDEASKPEVALASIRSSLTKSGGSVFEVADVALDIVGPTPFIPTGALNSLRRTTLEELQRALEQCQPPKNIAREERGLPYPIKHLRGDHNVVNSLAREFYTDHGVEHIDEGYDLLPDLKGVEVMRTPYCLRREIGHCTNKGSGLKEPLRLVHGTESFRLRFDCKECLMYVIKE